MPPPVIGIALLVVVAIGVALFAVLGKKSDVHERLAAIDAAAGLTQQTSSSLLKRVMDERQRHALSRRLQEAGWYNVTPQKMLMWSLGGLAGGAGAGVFAVLVLNQHTGIFYALPVMFGICGAYFPHFRLNGAIEERKISIHRQLPDFLDMLSTTVEAGIGLNGALATTVDGLQGALGDELRAALQDIRLGRSRGDALLAMASRVREGDLTMTVTAIVQSEKTGGSISAVLDQLAGEARERRIMRAEEIAGQLPTKLIFPMALCMLPALFVIIFGSVAAKFTYHP
ncbi:MAG TPA: type II secretion system F family protein [Candidatus Dormibacteraeota bacterium]|nr:type II secretion system F family protein [Candidatus Dormibacteraeota bacterium]